MTDIVISDGIQYTDSETDGLANEINESANATSSVNDGVGGSVIHITLTESVDASSSVLVGGEEGTLESTAVATAALVTARTLRLNSNASATSTALGKKIDVITITESAGAASAAVGAFATVVAETAAAVATLTPARVMSLQSNAAASASPTTNRTVTATINSSIATDDTVGAPALTNEDESANVSSAVIGVRRVVVEINDTAGSSASSASLARAIMSFASGANATTTAVYHTVAQQVVADSADAFEFVKLPASAIPNFWSNTMTGAPATWSGLPFNSMISYGGRLFAAGEDGLFELLNGADDIDTPIDAQVTWDADDFGSNQRKRLHAVYIYASAAGPFTVRVTNEQGTFDYETPAPRSFAPINHRAQPGKGLRATTNRISILSSSDFGANPTTVDYEEIGRKI